MIADIPAAGSVFESPADFARRIGVGRSRIHAYDKAGRLVKQGDLIDAGASIVLIQQSRSPGHDDQAAAFRDAPAASSSASASLGAGEAPSGMPSSTPFSAHDASPADKIGNSFQAARAVGERYKAMTLKRDYEISTGELVRAADVRHATSRAAVVLRTGLESLAITLYSATRGVDDEAKFSAIVTEIIEYQLTALSNEFATLAEASAH